MILPKYIGRGATISSLTANRTMLSLMDGGYQHPAIYIYIAVTNDDNVVAYIYAAVKIEGYT